jgi:hypothetical protein
MSTDNEQVSTGRRAFLSRGRYQRRMEQTSTETLSFSKRLTLRYIAEGELHASEMDWVAVQWLKGMGLAEERGTAQ